MKHLGRLALIFFVSGSYGARRQALNERFKRIGLGLSRRGLSTCGRSRGLRITLVVFCGDIRKNKTVAVARHRSNKPWLARIVADRPADRPNRLAQGTVGDDHIAPDAIEDVAPVHGLAAMLDEKDEQIEVARDEGHFLAVSEEQPAAR